MAWFHRLGANLVVTPTDPQTCLSRPSRINTF